MEHLSEVIESLVATMQSEMGLNRAIREAPETLITILNSGMLDESLRRRYLKMLSDCSIEDIGQVKNQILWDEILDMGLVECNAHNILVVAGRDGGSLSAALVGFLEKCGVPENLTFKTEKALGCEFSILVAACHSDLSVGRTRELAAQYGEKVEARELENVLDEWLVPLIDYRLIAVDAEGLESMRVHHSELCSAYAAQDVDAYIRLVSDGGDGEPPCRFVRDEVLGVFCNSAVSVSAKLALLESYTPPVVPLDERYPDELTVAILDNNMFGGDFGYLTEMYRNRPTG